MSAVAITGLGAVSSLGIGVAALRTALEHGHDGLRPITRFDTQAYTTRLGGIVPELRDAHLEDTADRLAAIDDLLVTFGCLAAREALAQAGGAVPPARVALVFGTCVGVGFRRFHTVAARIADAIDARGPRLVATTACAASTLAIGLGRDLLEAGHADRVVALGADVLLPEIFAGFNAVGALSRSKCAPFSGPVGTTLGEGAGALVLERIGDARDTTPLALLLGYGLSADAWHETAPDPSGAGIARALTSALVDAGLGASEIDYVNAHGTGTEANDIAEVRAIRSVLGAHAETIPVSASKSIIGHAQGAAGVLEVIVTITSMRAGAVPPTLHSNGPRPGAPSDPVFHAGWRPHPVRRALSTSAGFGGANAVVALADADIAGPLARSTRPARPIYLTGAGLVSGGDRSALERELRADPRGVDASALYLTVAIRRALAAAHVDLHGPLRDRAGLVAAMTRVSPESYAEFTQSAERRGLARVSAGAFARMVLNAPAGTAAKLVSLRGALATLTTGPGSGVVAVAVAAELLARRDDLELIVAAGVDEADVDPTPETPGPTDLAHAGASALVLTATRGGARIAGIGLAGPAHLDDACARALAGRVADVHIDDGSSQGAVTASAGGGACARALELLSDPARAVRSVLVTARGPCAAAALYLEAPHAGGSLEGEGDAS